MPQKIFKIPEKTSFNLTVVLGDVLSLIALINYFDYF